MERMALLRVHRKWGVCHVHRVETSHACRSEASTLRVEFMPGDSRLCRDTGEHVVAGQEGVRRGKSAPAAGAPDSTEGAHERRIQELLGCCDGVRSRRFGRRGRKRLRGLPKEI